MRNKKTMINILLVKKIYFNGNYYKVPEKIILKLLLDRNYGEIKLTLEQIY